MSKTPSPEPCTVCIKRVPRRIPLQIWDHYTDHVCDSCYMKFVQKWQEKVPQLFDEMV